MATIKIVLRKANINSNGSGPVYFRVTHNRKTRMINSELRCDEKDWDFKNERPYNKDLFHYLKKKQSKLESQLMSMEVVDISKLSLKPIKMYSIGLFEFGSMIIKEMLDAGRIGNAKAYVTALAQLSNVVQTEIPLQNLDYPILNRFKQFKENKGVSAAAIRSYLVAYRYIYNEAERRGMITRGVYPFVKGLIPKASKKKRGYLTLEELELLKNYKSENELDQQAVDVLLLSYYLRGIDFTDLILLGKAKKGYVKYSRKKLINGKELKVKILPEAMLIIDKYSGSDKLLNLVPYNPLNNPSLYARSRGKLKRINIRARNIADKLGIEQRLTSKIMRHTFATHAKLKGVKREVIAEMMGHNWNTVTDVYLNDYSQDVIDEAHFITIYKK